MAERIGLEAALNNQRALDELTLAAEILLEAARENPDIAELKRAAQALSYVLDNMRIVKVDDGSGDNGG